MSDGTSSTGPEGAEGAWEPEVPAAIKKSGMGLLPSGVTTVATEAAHGSAAVTLCSEGSSGLGESASLAAASEITSTAVMGAIGGTGAGGMASTSSATSTKRSFTGMSVVWARSAASCSDRSTKGSSSASSGSPESNVVLARSPRKVVSAAPAASKSFEAEADSLAAATPPRLAAAWEARCAAAASPQGVSLASTCLR